MSEATNGPDWLTIQVPIAKDCHPTADELSPVVLDAIEKALVNR